MELKKLAMKLLSLMAKALKMKDEEMRDVFEEGMQSMRMNYYPPCPQPDLAIGLSPHSDGTGLTILLQGNEMEGLQIKKDGMWIPVTPLPGAFVVNIGDMLEIVTNGTYRSIEHRATVNSEKREALHRHISQRESSMETSVRPPAFSLLKLHHCSEERVLQTSSECIIPANSAGSHIWMP
ncbi:2-oxoglutarate (2OG) and Fe(II)-dependent oxygenase superfamily protein [Actinidia rufa]|uniref:2-oxoglutarate (2OG) and Fe(II)-dependent oxygenase superfamily protein n=1 Tax=Actinidia rufa TaxID=165716 RepID=A0A7J0G8R5_9ERIC|nr:2-oxoglutarate (2OG) and Fe(II)-dependent oxygenase superfamily protein [Actinidia rufa]